tara:strand:- start:192 stop:1130 length:939 start_codon:yes stop_codon:yes gene_type:complete
MPYTTHPKLKGILTSQFKNQLSYIEKHYKFVTVQDLLDSIYSTSIIPSNAILLTFDDGYADHFTAVFPILEEKGIQGCFFPPAKAILNHTVLDVNKIHFLLASVPNIHILLDDVFECLDQYRLEYALESNDYYLSKLAVASNHDPKEITFIKRLFQVELKQDVQKTILDQLFNKYVTGDEEAFARELYMDIDQIKCMVRNGMYIGSHGYEHYWLNNLKPKEQELEIDKSLEFLDLVNAPTENWVMCYPYGAYDDSLIETLMKKGCAIALTTRVDIALLSGDNAYTLERLDTNDFPKDSNSRPNKWTRRILSS